MRNDFKTMQIISISLLYSGLLGILEISYVGGSTTSMDAYTSTISPPITETVKQSHKVASTITQPVTTLSEQSSDTSHNVATTITQPVTTLSEQSSDTSHNVASTITQPVTTLSEQSSDTKYSGPPSSNTSGIIIGCFVGLIIFIIILALIIILRKRKCTSFDLPVKSEELGIPLNNC